MPINLSKGQKVDLTKGNPGLTKIMVGLGWDVNAFDSGADFDLDILLGRPGGNDLSTGALDGSLVVLRMDPVLHCWFTSFSDPFLRALDTLTQFPANCKPFFGRIIGCKSLRGVL